jgi:hypothetical protein
MLAEGEEKEIEGGGRRKKREHDYMGPTCQWVSHIFFVNEKWIPHIFFNSNAT